MSFLTGVTKAMLRSVGLEISRPRTVAREPPPLLDDPDEALHLVRGGGRAAVRAPLEDCVQYAGFSYDPSGWHPFVRTLRRLPGDPEGATPRTSQFDEAAMARAYSESFLRRYFEAWQPPDAGAALIGAVPPPPSLQALPSYAFIFPWAATTPEERLRAVAGIVSSENEGAGLAEVGIAEGYNQHGPVSMRKGALEYHRLLHCMAVLRSGWNRSDFGDATATLLSRGVRRRYLILHGHHRAAAASALGQRTIPVTLGVPRAVGRSDAGDWPQVRRGAWTRDAAENYFDHLFDFDAADWAGSLGLERPLRPPTPAALDAHSDGS